VIKKRNKMGFFLTGRKPFSGLISALTIWMCSTSACGCERAKVHSSSPCSLVSVRREAGYAEFKKFHYNPG